MSRQEISVILNMRSSQFSLRLRWGGVSRGTYREVPHVTDDLSLRHLFLVKQSLVFFADWTGTTSGSFTTNCSKRDVILHLHVFARGWVLTS